MVLNQTQYQLISQSVSAFPGISSFGYLFIDPSSSTIKPFAQLFALEATMRKVLN